MGYLVLILCVICGFSGVLTHLVSIGVKCGAKRCDKSQYCSDFDSLCKPCSVICDEESHNVDATKCSNDCQYYLHQKLFGMSQSGDSNLRDEVRRLHSMVSICLALICIMLFCFVVFWFIRLFRWKKKHQVTMKWIRNKFNLRKKSDNQVPTVAVTNNSGKPDLRLDMPNTISNHSISTVTNTPSTASTNISRRPAEDSTLDYAYDNPAMATTPSPNNKMNKPHESSL